jgi:ABC-type transport system substrate-binding protein
LCRKTDWWCKAKVPVTAELISLFRAESTTHIRDQFEFADLSIVCADPGSDRYVDYRCDYELWDCENGIFVYLGCNTESELFSIPEVRGALTHAIDREFLIEGHYRGFARSATLPASPLSPFYSNQLAARYGYDAEKFTQALTAANASGAAVRLLVNKADTLRLQVARSIMKMLTDCGLQVELLSQTGEDYHRTLSNKEFDLYLGQTKLSPNMDLSCFFEKNAPLRYGGMTDAATYAMCLEALANRGNYYNLHQTVMEDGRLCPLLFFSYSIYATRGLMHDLAPARDAIYYYNTGKLLSDVRIQLD